MPQIFSLKSGLKTYNDLPQTDSTMDCKSLLLNTDKNNFCEVNNLMNNKIYWAFVNKENIIQSIYSLLLTTEGCVGILRDELDSNQQVLLAGVTTLTSYFVSIGDKGVTTAGNQQFLDEPGTEELKAVGGPPPTFITPPLLGMNEEVDSQIVVIPKIFPLELGETIPFGYSLENPLTICDLYPEGFTAWFATLN